jgi:hypothetical protein
MMIRLGIVAGLLAACGGARDKPTEQPTANPLLGCMQPTRAQADAAANAAEGNAAAFREGLKRRGLQLKPLAHDILFTAGRPDARVPADVVLTRDTIPDKLQYTEDMQWTATVPMTAPCGGYDDFTEFGIDEQRRLWRVVRKPRVVSETTHELCGCQGSFDGCVGPAHSPNTEIQTLFQIPDGTTFGGAREVPYDVTLVHFHYTQHDAEGRFLRCSIPG